MTNLTQTGQTMTVEEAWARVNAGHEALAWLADHADTEEERAAADASARLLGSYHFMFDTSPEPAAVRALRGMRDRIQRAFHDSSEALVLRRTAGEIDASQYRFDIDRLQREEEELLSDIDDALALHGQAGGGAERDTSWVDRIAADVDAFEQSCTEAEHTDVSTLWEMLHEVVRRVRANA